MFPHLGPEWIESLLDWFARPEDRLNRSLPEGLESGSSTEDEAIGAQRGKTERGTSKMEDYDD